MNGKELADKICWDYDGKYITAHVDLDDSNYLYLEVSPGRDPYWSVSAWRSTEEEDGIDDCWFTTDVSGDINRCSTSEEAMKCAASFVEHFQQSLDREIDLLNQFVERELAAIAKLREMMTTTCASL